jgi:hypothetical protein
MQLAEHTIEEAAALVFAGKLQRICGVNQNGNQGEDAQSVHGDSSVEQNSR